MSRPGAVPGPVTLALLALTLLALGFAAGWTVRALQSSAIAASAIAASAVAAPGPAPGPEPANTAPDPAVPGPLLVAQDDPRHTAFEAALLTRDHEAALRIYERVADAGDEPELVAALRELFLDPVRSRRGDPDGLAAAVAFLEQLTWLYPRDLQALTQLAEGQERLGRARAALDSWWQAGSAAGGGPAAETRLRRARLLVDMIASNGVLRDDAEARAALYRTALEHDPGAHRFRVMLAEALDAGGAHREALDVLDAVPAGVLDEARLERVRRRLEESARLAVQFPDGLPLTRRGEHFVVEVHTAAGEPLRLLLDTGATVTVLKPAVLGRIAQAAPAGRTIRLGTAAGIVSAPVYDVSGLRLGPLQVQDLQVAAMSLEGLEGIDGLLGMDQLSRFDFRIDPAAGRLLLAHRRDRGAISD